LPSEDLITDLSKISDLFVKSRRSSFVFKGKQLAATEIAKKLGVELNEKGEIKIDRSSRTNIKGVYAAGDVVDSEFKQAITGVAEGVHAAYQAYKYVNENEFVFTCNEE